MEVLDDEEVLAAVVDTFVHAFPRTLAGARAEPGTAVSVEVTGPVARRWTFIRSVDGWTREDGVVSSKAAAFLRTDADAFWRLLSGGLDRTSQVERVDLAGKAVVLETLKSELTRGRLKPMPRSTDCEEDASEDDLGPIGRLELGSADQLV